MNLKNLFLQDHSRVESINLSTQFPMFLSISQEEDFSKSTNLLLQQSLHSEFSKEEENWTQLKSSTLSSIKLIWILHQCQNH